MERNWLIRTKKNKILGPLSKDKVIELYEAKDLTDNDEICSGNGFWFWVKEEDLVNRYLLGDEQQPFNPVQEASSVLCQTEGSGSVLAKGPQKKKDSTQVLKIPQDLIKKKDDKGNLIPAEDDLDYPDDNFVAEVKNKKEVFDLNVSSKNSKKSHVKKDNRVQKTKVKVSSDQEQESAILPSHEDLDYPEDSSDNKKNIKKKVRADNVKRSRNVNSLNTKSLKRRNDHYLFIVLAGLIIAICYVIYTYYTDILGYKVIGRKLAPFVNTAYAQDLISTKKKSQIGPFQIAYSLDGIQIEYNVDDINCDKSYDLYALALLKKNNEQKKLFQLLQLPKCQDLLNVDIQSSLTAENDKRNKLYLNKINKLRKYIEEQELKKEFDDKEIYTYTTYLGLLYRIGSLVSSKEYYISSKLIKELIKTPVKYLVYEMSLLPSLKRDNIKKEVINYLRLISTSKKISLKQRYLLLMSIDDIDDREIKRLINDFQFSNNEDEYFIKPTEYQYFLKYLPFWIERQSDSIAKKPLIQNFFKSPLRLLFNINDINLFRYYYSNNFKIDERLKLIYNKEIKKLTTYQLEKILYSLHNGIFKKKIGDINPIFKKPLFQLERRVYKEKVYEDVHGVYALLKLIELGEYDKNFFWWFYEL